VETETIGVIDNLLTVDEFNKKVDELIAESGVARDKIRIAALDGELLVEQEYEEDKCIICGQPCACLDEDEVCPGCVSDAKYDEWS
jgi:rubrerythrin